MTTSEVSVCNRALQRLGAERITSRTDDTRNARAVNANFDQLRDAELRRYRWRFAIARATLAPTGAVPYNNDFNYQFLLPADCLRVLKPEDDPYCDWSVEGRAILSNASDTLYLRYISRVEDPNVWDALFVEALAMRIAREICEQLTQSNTKQQGIIADYKEVIREARNTNAFETLPAEAATDTWTLARL